MMCALIFLEECMGLIRFSELMSYRRWRTTKQKALSLIFAFLNPFFFSNSLSQIALKHFPPP